MYYHVVRLNRLCDGQSSPTSVMTSLTPTTNQKTKQLLPQFPQITQEPPTHHVIRRLHLLQDHQGCVYYPCSSPNAPQSGDDRQLAPTHLMLSRTHLLPTTCRRYPLAQALRERQGLCLPRHPATEPWPCGAFLLRCVSFPAR